MNYEYYYNSVPAHGPILINEDNNWDEQEEEDDSDDRKVVYITEDNITFTHRKRFLLNSIGPEELSLQDVKDTLDSPFEEQQEEIVNIVINKNQVKILFKPPVYAGVVETNEGIQVSISHAQEADLNNYITLL